MAAHFCACFARMRRGGVLVPAWDAYVGRERGMPTWDAGTGVVIQIVNRSVTHWKQCVRLHLIDPGIG